MKMPHPLGWGFQLGGQTAHRLDEGKYHILSGEGVILNPAVLANAILIDRTTAVVAGRLIILSRLIVLILAPGLGTHKAENHQSHFIGAVGFVTIVTQNLARVAVAQTDIATSIVRTQVLTDCVGHIVGLDYDFVAIVLDDEIVVEVFHSFYHFLSSFVP
jgi:hypothetical protein